MKRVKVLDKEFEVSIPAKEIDAIISGLAARMNNDLKNKDVIFLGILNGSFMFAADLYRKITLESTITFLKLASYDGTSSTGVVKRLIGFNESIKGKTVVVLEDIVDSGNTIENIIMQLKGYEPKEIKIATLVYKPEAYKKDYHIDYVGLEIPNDFIVGYGLDYDGYGRNLADIYTLVNDDVKAENLLNFVVLGMPSSGKGTHASKLANKYNLHHISTGDILRDEIAHETEMGKLAGKLIDNGEFVSDEIIIKIIEGYIDRNRDAKGFIFDGFPRTINQAKEFNEMLEKKGIKINSIFELEIDKQTVQNRMIKRGQLTNRITDQDIETIKRRLEIYEETTRPITQYFDNNINSINADGKISEVFQSIINIIEK